jgi:hypothetical protein
VTPDCDGNCCNIVIWHGQVVLAKH